jgi:hypothetical protein
MIEADADPYVDGHTGAIWLATVIAGVTEPAPPPRCREGATPL